VVKLLRTDTTLDLSQKARVVKMPSCARRAYKLSVCARTRIWFQQSCANTVSSLRNLQIINLAQDKSISSGQWLLQLDCCTAWEVLFYFPSFVVPTGSPWSSSGWTFTKFYVYPLVPELMKCTRSGDTYSLYTEDGIKCVSLSTRVRRGSIGCSSSRLSAKVLSCLIGIAWGP